MIEEISNHIAICPICRRRFHGGWFHPADQNLYEHMIRGKSHRRHVDEISWDTRNWHWMEDISNRKAECPTCNRIFHCGWFHPADQKLYDHMRNGKAHRSHSDQIPWDTRNWHYASHWHQENGVYAGVIWNWLIWGLVCDMCRETSM